MKELDPERLKEFNGKDGKPVYIAHKGRVIDVTNSKFWKTGLHMQRHPSGTDLTTDIAAAPHGIDVLDRYPQVGVLKGKEEAPKSMPGWMAGLLDRFPILRRHPHPMVVHFPIVFSFSAALFNLLYLITGHRPFETTALHCLGGGVLFTPVAILTGYFTWWLNYLAKPMRAVTLKVRFSFLLWVLSILLFLWRISVFEIMRPLAGGTVVYFLLILLLVPVVTVIGWFGATLTFPVEKR